MACRLVQSSKYRLSPAADRFNAMEFVAIKRVERIAAATDELLFGKWFDSKEGISKETRRKLAQRNAAQLASVATKRCGV